MERLYKQVDGVAMGSSLGLILANTFLVYFEKNWLQNCPSDFKPHSYRRYVDDIFVLFNSPEHLEAFRNFLYGRHTNLSFTTENENQNRISFLDMQIIHNDKTFAISAYRKPTFSGVYTYFYSILPSTYKLGTVYALAYIYFRIDSSWTKLHTELVCLKQIFLKNGYPENFIHVLKDLWITNTQLKGLL